VAQQLELLHPLAAPIWIAGLLWLLVLAAGRPFRALGLTYLLVLGLLLALNGRVYYLAPAYPMLFAAGALAIEGWLSRRRWARVACVSGLALGGALLAPFAIPLLPPEAYLAYSRALHLEPPPVEHRQTSELPQFFADRFGWPEMAEAAARVYRALPAGERAKACIFGQDYGQAGAIDFYGPALGLPKALSGHLTYWYWGPRDATGEVVIVLGEHDRSKLEEKFESVEDAAVVSHRYSMQSQNFTIYLCRKPRGWTLKEIWPKVKNFS
jgi:hypothetical protein